MNGINEPEPTETETGESARPDSLGITEDRTPEQLAEDGDAPAGPSPEDVEKWTAAVHEIMERDGVTEAQANAGLLWAIIDDEIRADIAQLAEDQTNRDRWTAVIESLMARFVITEDEANFNLIALLQWVEDHPGEDFPNQ